MRHFPGKINMEECLIYVALFLQIEVSAGLLECRAQR